MKQTFWLLLFIFLPIIVTAQWRPSPAELFMEAEEYFLFEEFNEALPLYMRTASHPDSLSSFVRYRVGICYLNLPGQEYHAVAHLEFAAANAHANLKTGSLNEPGAPLDAFYYLGLAYRHTNQTENSKVAFTEFIERSTDQVMIAKAERELEKTYAAALFRMNAGQFEKTPVYSEMGLTGEEFNLVISGDENTISYAGSLKFYDAVFYNRKANGTWGKPVNITPQVGSDGDVYPLSLSMDGNMLLLYRNDFGTNGDIFYSSFVNGRWTRMEAFPSPVNTEYHEAYASLSPDGKTIYFSSNRPGGFGGLDIYKSVRDGNGNWGPAINLGPQVNTMENETTPFVSMDGKYLFFSSEGHTNIGGLDIFFSEKLADGSWGQAVNPGYPLNTTADDKFLIPAGKYDEAYYAFITDQQYMAREFMKIRDFMKNSDVSVQVTVNISESHSGLSHEPAAFQLIDTRTQKILNTFSGIPENGYHAFKLNPGYYELKLKKARYQTALVDFVIERYYPKPEMTFSLELIPEPVKLELRNLYFSFDNFSLAESEKVKLAGLIDFLKEYYALEMELIGYTDISGDRNYNIMLAGRRAAMVRDFLVSKGITAERIKTKAIGPANYIATNDMIEGRRLNRRVEIHIENLPGFVKLEKLIDIPEHLRFR